MTNKCVCHVFAVTESIPSMQWKTTESSPSFYCTRCSQYSHSSPHFHFLQEYQHTSRTFFHHTHPSRVRNTNTMFQVHTLIIYLHRRRFAVRERISRSQIQSSKADPAHPPFLLFIKSKLNEDLIYKSKQ